MTAPFSQYEAPPWSCNRPTGLYGQICLSRLMVGPAGLTRPGCRARLAGPAEPDSPRPPGSARRGSSARLAAPARACAICGSWIAPLTCDFALKGG